MPPKHQGFCFTHNNWAETDQEQYTALHASGYFRWVIWGKETAPTTGTPHLQGFFWLSEPKQLAVVKKKFRGAWVAVPGKDKGPDYWLAYCQKQDIDATILGVQPTQEEFLAQVPKGQGKRTDLLDVKKKIDQGISCEELMEDDDHFGAFAGHAKFFQQYQSAKRRRKGYCMPEVHVRWGGTGTCKSRFVWEKYNYDTSKLFKLAPDMVTNGKAWYDGYYGHEAVLIEEFRPGHLKYNTLLDITDGYPTQVQIKGVTVHWSPKAIYITSPNRPEEWYPNLTAKDKIDQLMRRITSITCTNPAR